MSSPVTEEHAIVAVAERTKRHGTPINGAITFAFPAGDGAISGSNAVHVETASLLQGSNFVLLPYFI